VEAHHAAERVLGAIVELQRFLREVHATSRAGRITDLQAAQFSADASAIRRPLGGP
jgi:hypothetical protein